MQAFGPPATGPAGGSGSGARSSLPAGRPYIGVDTTNKERMRVINNSNQSHAHDRLSKRTSVRLVLLCMDCCSLLSTPTSWCASTPAASSTTGRSNNRQNTQIFSTVSTALSSAPDLRLCCLLCSQRWEFWNYLADLCSVPSSTPSHSPSPSR
jgi:hypothetical protein